MLADHMGLTGSEAERFADEMTEHMQGIDSDFDVQEMLDWCTEQADEGEYGPGMMDGYGRGYGGFGMMDPDDTAYGGYGMMGGMMDGYYSLEQGWHMMGTVPLVETGSTDQATTAPTAPEPEQNGYGPGNGSAPAGMSDHAHQWKPLHAPRGAHDGGGSFSGEYSYHSHPCHPRPPCH